MAESAEPVELSLTVIIATYNRSAVLRQTLEAMCAVDCSGLDVTYVVVDNNSSDDTASVIDSFSGRLPLTHLFQPVQGKSNALNLALETVPVGEVVVFTDDDVFPERDWLQAVAASLRAHPEYSVFGGRIVIRWPEGVEPPAWALENGFLLGAVWGEHDEGPETAPYPAHRHPSGGNWWFRRAVLDTGITFRADLGAGDLTMGEEGVFALALAERGFPSLYYPAACVGHLGLDSYFDLGVLKGRMVRLGRGFAHLRGLPDAAYYTAHPHLWRFRRLVSMARFRLLSAFAWLVRDEVRRVRTYVDAWLWGAYHGESLRLSLRREKEGPDAGGV